MWPFGGRFFPGTNLQDLNLDWIVQRVRDLSRGIIAPFINPANFHWMVWDTDAETFVDSGVSAAGEGTGPAGEPGKSPIIGENGNWYVWSIEAQAYVDTGTKAQGEGVPGRSPIIGQNGNWFVWNTATEVYTDTGVAAQGPKGDTGPGVPAGGAAGEILVKSANADYAAQWRNLNLLTSLKNKKCLLIGDSYNAGVGGASGRGWGYYFTQYSECASTIVHQNGGGFAALGNTGTASYPGKTYAECVPSITGDFDYIIAQAGWNDASESQNPGGAAAIRDGVAAFISACRSKWPNAKIVILATHNGTDARFDKVVKLNAITSTALANNAVSPSYSIYWMNNRGLNSDDNIHLTDEGYQLLARLILDYVYGWDGVYKPMFHYIPGANDKITVEGITLPGVINVWFDDVSAYLSFDVTITEAPAAWAMLLHNLPIPKGAIYLTMSNWSDPPSRNIRVGIVSPGDLSIRYGNAGNYRIYCSYPLQ